MQAVDLRPGCTSLPLWAALSSLTSRWCSCPSESCYMTAQIQSSHVLTPVLCTSFPSLSPSSVISAHSPTIAAKKFKKLVGKETYSETLESTPTMEKEKFPQDYFPEVGQVMWIKHPSVMKQDWWIWTELFLHTEGLKTFWTLKYLLDISSFIENI